MWKNNVISKSSKLQASNKSKDALSLSKEVYSISENSLKRKANKQIILTSYDEVLILLQSLKMSKNKKK